MQGSAVPSVAAEAAALPSHYAAVMEQKMAAAWDLKSMLRTKIAHKCDTESVESLLAHTSLWAESSRALLAKVCAHLMTRISNS